MLSADINYKAQALQSRLAAQRPDGTDNALQQLGQALGQVRLKKPTGWRPSSPPPAPSPKSTIHGFMKP